MNYTKTTAAIVRDLRELAQKLDEYGATSLPETQVTVNIQVCTHDRDSDEDDRVALVTDLCTGLFDVEPVSKAHDSLFGTPVFGVDVGCVNVSIFTGIVSQRERALAAEVERLRGQLGECEARNQVPSEERLAEIEAEEAEEQDGHVDWCECEDCEDLEGSDG